MAKPGASAQDEFRVPAKWLAEFEGDLRVYLKPLPGIFPIDPGMLAKMRPELLKQFKVILVPNQTMIGR